MNYTGIIQSLPAFLAQDLQKHLDAIELRGDETHDELATLFDDAIQKAKLGQAYHDIHDAEKRRLVDTLLDFLPAAGVRTLFG